MCRGVVVVVVVVVVELACDYECTDAHGTDGEGSREYCVLLFKMFPNVCSHVLQTAKGRFSSQDPAISHLFLLFSN
uniref:Putative secreted peptide n=1 Tax=Anopheles braziliensis TaxID=58242 RepID=A0A2M3ZPZ1_9DIPT